MLRLTCNLGSVALALALAVPVGAFLVGVDAAHAKQTAEQKCRRGRYDAAAKYGACYQKAQAKLFAGGEFDKYRAAVGKCLTAYMATWAKLQKKASGTGETCDQARFADNGTTVTDNLTGLQWEKKNDDCPGGIHCVNDAYTWSATGTAADGTAFTSFLRTLNSDGCFAGQCDWRLPTPAELQTILLTPSPCSTNPCIDAVFGPTAAKYYWSATTLALRPIYAWLVDFVSGTVVNDLKANDVSVRAVRGGL